MKKETVSWICYAVFSLLFFCACGNSDVNFVKKGTMDGYETTTIGKAFDASFEEPKWEAFESKKGEKVVVSRVLCKIIKGQFFKEWQVVMHFSYGV